MKKVVLIAILFLYSIGEAQVKKIEPPNWWVGFKEQELQIMVYNPKISETTVHIDYPGVKIKSVDKADSPNYLFINLVIGEQAQPGTFQILFKKKKRTVNKVAYQLKSRTKKGEEFIGFDNTDAIYLITPDRFVNANPDNDIIKGLKETDIDRTDGYSRHGGDIEGITSKLDYIQQMGFTSIWSCPLLINDMAEGSYHGYAITDYYQVDPRFGTFNEYLNLAKETKSRGMKLIMDQVANHCGLGHWWMTDLPFNDWVNFQEHYLKGEKTIYSNHRRTTNQDPYASNYDKLHNADGWFVDTMPDLNQRNPYMAKYIIQNSIWWIETLELGGIRQDTYPYPDKTFMANWAKSIMTEYPNFSIVGEEWSYNPLLVSYWQDGMNNKDGYRSHLTSTMDFPMQKLIVEALTEKETWATGLVKIYEGLANDFIYPNPKKIMLFADNHDMSRIYTQLGEDPVLTKMAMAYILTLPRIPQVYYGTEILMDDTAKPGDHGLIRTDFPGGWANDQVNAFTGKGLTQDQKDMQQFLKNVLNFRKESAAIHRGTTVHFAPQQHVYILAREFENEQVILILNKNKQPVQLDLAHYKELNLEGKMFTNIVTMQPFNFQNTIELKNQGVILLSSTKQ